MPVDARIRLYINSHLAPAIPDDVFETQLDVIVLDIVELLATRPVDAVHTAAYLGYAISRQYLRSANVGQQARFSGRMTWLLRRLYNDAGFIQRISAADRYSALCVVQSFYQVHYALTRNGLLADEGPLSLDIGEPLRQLQVILGAAFGPWPAWLHLQGGIRDYYYSRVSREADSAEVHIEIGRSATAGPGLNLRVATWNLQGFGPGDEHKWRTDLLHLARNNDLVVVQEAGVLPSSARLVQRLDVADQFGVFHQVDQYLWQAGTAGRPEEYQVYFLDVQRLRVNLAVVVPMNDELEVMDLTVIADGVAEAGDVPPYRPTLGLQVRRRTDGGAPGRMITVFNFHAIAGGGVNAPRMLREISWHTGTEFVLLGDFNRDPRPPAEVPTASGNWISPADIARPLLAAGATHPSTSARAMLDYAVSNGSVLPVAPGIVGAPGASDHLSVSYLIRFS